MNKEKINIKKIIDYLTDKSSLNPPESHDPSSFINPSGVGSLRKTPLEVIYKSPIYGENKKDLPNIKIQTIKGNNTNTENKNNNNNNNNKLTNIQTSNGNNTNTENNEQKNKEMIETMTSYLNTTRDNHQYKYTKNFTKIIKNIFTNKNYLYNSNCQKGFSTIIKKGTKYYKSYGYNITKTFNNTLFRKSPFMWFAFNEEIAKIYGTVVYDFNLKKDVKLINICSSKFIKDFTKKINLIFADYEFIRDLLFFPFGNISPILQKYYLLKGLNRGGGSEYKSENVLDKIVEDQKNLYSYLLFKGKRESLLMTDSILMFVLMKLYPEYDGYIASDNDYSFHTEICLFNPYDKIMKLSQKGGTPNQKNLKKYEVPQPSISPSAPHPEQALLGSTKNISYSIGSQEGLSRMRSRWSMELAKDSMSKINPLQYNIEENLNLILKLKSSIEIFLDNLIKDLLPMCNEILLLNNK